MSSITVTLEGHVATIVLDAPPNNHVSGAIVGEIDRATQHELAEQHRLTATADFREGVRARGRPGRRRAPCR